jgi:hypothetical protein
MAPFFKIKVHSLLLASGYFFVMYDTDFNKIEIV